MEESVHNEKSGEFPPDAAINDSQKLSAQELKKMKKEDSKNLKKDEKNLEQFMKSLNSASNDEEKLSLACKKYLQSMDTIKKLQFYTKQSEKRYALLLKEKDQQQHEFNKIILMKSKLENLCRELQKQNKSIKEESLMKIREEEEKRKETQAKFQSTLNEITSLLQQNNERNTKLRDDNTSMNEKFHSLVTQYQLREEQLDKMAKQMALESKLADAKLQKAHLEHQAEKEKMLAEMQQLKVTIVQNQAKMITQSETEAALKNQVQLYTKRYNEFESAIVKSNQLYGGFKEQMDSMSKTIKKLESEALAWKRKWESSQTALLDMCSDRQTQQQQLATTARQLQHMQGLCRTLQAERALLVSTLEEHKIERPSLPPQPQLPIPNKMDAVVSNCTQLKQSLATLQNHLNVLKNKNGTEESKGKQKKLKVKKNKSDKQAQDVEDPTNIATDKENKDDNQMPETASSESQNEISDSAPPEKVDNKTMESLIRAINNANISLSSLDNSQTNSEDHKVVDDENAEIAPDDAKEESINHENDAAINQDLVPELRSTETVVNDVC